jgi:folylpolyglutamate synthase/dihydropteroate synthase
VEDVQGAVQRARELATAGEVIVITGSIYLVGEVMGSLGTEVGNSAGAPFPLK